MHGFLRAVWQRVRYERWISSYEIHTESDLARLGREIGSLAKQPLISVVVPVFNTPAAYLTEMIESVRRQIYPHWELCLADDASDAPHVDTILRDYLRVDARIKLISRPVNGHISAASNSALALATGDYVALLDHDDVLPAHALAMVVKYLNLHPKTRLLYSDEDKISASGQRHSPFFKPDWDPELILQTNFFCHFGIYEAALVRELGGFREGSEGSQDHDLVLRCSRKVAGDAIVHIPHVLYHWREAEQSTALGLVNKPYALAAGVAAVKAHLLALGRDAHVHAPLSEAPRILVEDVLPPTAPAILIVVDAFDSHGLEASLEALLQRTAYPDFRLIVIAREQQPIRHVDVDIIAAASRPEAMAAANAAIAESSAEYVCLLDAQTLVDAPDWLTRLARLAAISDVGLAGARLCAKDGRVIAAGLVRVSAVEAVLAKPGRKRQGPGYFGLNQLTRQVSLLPGAGLVARRAVLIEAGGLPDEADWIQRGVVLSERVSALGLRNMLVGASTLIRAEKLRRATSVKRSARSAGPDRDRFYNPNLALGPNGATFRMGFPPRIESSE